MLKNLLIGLGNPILGDDGIGIYVAQLVRKNLPKFQSIDIKEVSIGGLRIIDELLGYDRAILVDATTAESEEIGKICKLKPEEFNSTLHLSTSHDLNFTTALELGKKYAPDKMPKEIVIYGIKVNEVSTFSDRLNPRVQKAGAKAAKIILKELKG
ncbi:MAG: hydrogenase maturation protease [Candidatus Bathyarchaeota archaeon]